MPVEEQRIAMNRRPLRRKRPRPRPVGLTAVACALSAGAACCAAAHRVADDAASAAAAAPRRWGHSTTSSRLSGDDGSRSSLYGLDKTVGGVTIEEENEARSRRQRQQQQQRQQREKNKEKIYPKGGTGNNGDEAVAIVSARRRRLASSSTATTAHISRETATAYASASASASGSSSSSATISASSSASATFTTTTIGSTSRTTSDDDGEHQQGSEDDSGGSSENEAAVSDDSVSDSSASGSSSLDSSSSGGTSHATTTDGQQTASADDDSEQEDGGCGGGDDGDDDGEDGGGDDDDGADDGKGDDGDEDDDDEEDDDGDEDDDAAGDDKEEDDDGDDSVLDDGDGYDDGEQGNDDGGDGDDDGQEDDGDDDKGDDGDDDGYDDDHDNEEDDDDGDDDEGDGDDDGGGDDDDDDGDDGEGGDTSAEGDDTVRSIQVLTPATGDVLIPDSYVEVTWILDGSEKDYAGGGGGGGSNSLLFHVDLYDCGDDQSCGGGCACGVGEFVLGLCPEEGCDCADSSSSSVSVLVPEVDGTGPYFRIAVSPDDGSSTMGCSGAFTTTSSADPELEPEPEQAQDLCATLGGIPYPLLGNLTVEVPANVTEVSCPTPTTVRVAGGTLTIAVDCQAVVFSGVRFEVESLASLVFSTDAPAEFTGIDHLEANGGVLGVSEHGMVEMSGSVTFRDNSVQGTANASSNGAAIYNEGIIHLGGEATFTGNLVHTGGDGGALWNGPSGRLTVVGDTTLEGNGVGPGGNGGGLWNEGLAKFEGESRFLFNEAREKKKKKKGGGRGRTATGNGGGMFNQGGVVQFEGPTTFSENEALAGSAFVNAAEGEMAMREEVSILDNLSKEEESSEAGAVWNEATAIVVCEGAALLERNRGYQAAAMLNAGEVEFRGGVSVRDNTAVMDGGGFINESGARIAFFESIEFIANVGTGYGGAILNFAELDFTGGDGDDSGDDSGSGSGSGGGATTVTTSFTLHFEDNYCGEQECQDIQNKDGSSVLGIHEHVPDLCAIGTEEFVA
ncbi:unnamed protein product [Pylaiella littoralis]